MPKVNEAHIEAHRQQILEAANAHFSRQVFHQTSVHDICREAELSPGAVYRYFPGKEHIIVATCSGCQQGISALIESARSRGGSPLQTLDFIVGHGLEMLSEESFLEVRMINVQVWSEAMRSAEIREALLTVSIGTLGQAFSKLFLKAQEQGQVDGKLDSKALAITLMGIFHGLVLHKSLDSTIDIRVCSSAMRAMYQGLFLQTTDAE